MKILVPINVLVFFLLYQKISLKPFPNHIVITTVKNKNIPNQYIIESELNESEPNLKISPKIDLPAIDFILIDHFKVLPNLYIDKKDSEYEGISLVDEALKSDMNRVIGEKVDQEGKVIDNNNGLTIVTEKSLLSGKAIIAGTFGENGNDVINQLINEGTVDIKDLENRWESYQMQVVKKPFNGVDEALVIIGTDKRGTIYGLFHISEIMGISPWVWWADVLPEVQSKVTLPGDQCNLISKEPSIKYRGIFLNVLTFDFKTLSTKSIRI